MTDAFIGEIRMFGGGYAPEYWALCDGATLPIADNDTLFSLIGTTYGGDGVTTFGLPDLRGRLPVHQGNGAGLSPRTIGSNGGTETVTLTPANMPMHAHGVIVSTDAGTLDGPGPTAVPAAPTNGVTPFLYVLPGTNPVVPGPMAASSIGPAGGNAAHANMMPSLCVSFIIALQGVYPNQD